MSYCIPVEVMRELGIKGKESFRQEVTINSHLSRGGFGNVFWGTHYSNGSLKQAAIKIVRLSGFGARAPVDVLPEMVFLSQFRHKRLVKAFDTYVDEQCIYMVLEKAEEDLCSYRQRSGFLHEDKLKEFFQQIVEGLKHLHDNNIAHRDIKASNILLVQGVAKIADLGLAIACDQLLEKRCGSKPYMAPEVLDCSGPYDGRAADIWSLGVLLYSLVFGDFPFGSGGYSQVLLKQQSLDIRDLLLNRQPEVSHQLHDLLLQLLVLNPCLRPQVDDVLNHPWLTGIDNKPCREELVDWGMILRDWKREDRWRRRRSRAR